MRKVYNIKIFKGNLKLIDYSDMEIVCRLALKQDRTIKEVYNVNASKGFRMNIQKEYLIPKDTKHLAIVSQFQ